MATLAGLARDIPRGLQVYLQPEPPPGEIDLGTCVRVSLSGGSRKADMTEEGVVVEVVGRRRPIMTKGICWAYSAASSRSSVNRYVVQTRSNRVVRRAAELVVVCL